MNAPEPVDSGWRYSIEQSVLDFHAKYGFRPTFLICGWRTRLRLRDDVLLMSGTATYAEVLPPPQQYEQIKMFCINAEPDYCSLGLSGDWIVSNTEAHP